MIPARTRFSLICLCAVVLLVIPGEADLISPAITHVYFERNGMPYHGSVQYSINCYGYTVQYPSIQTRPPGSYLPALVYHYSATCKEYGCSVYPEYYLQYTHIDWCNLEGNTGDGPFIVRNFSSLPYTRCHGIPDRIFIGEWTRDERTNNQHYFYATPEYAACRIQNRSSHYPYGDNSRERRIYSSCNNEADTSCFSLFEGFGDIKQMPGGFATVVNTTLNEMDEPRFIEYLEFCDPLSDDSCGGWILDGKPLKTYANLFPFLTNATHLQQDPCDRFLVAMNSSLVIPESNRSKQQCVETCSFADELCTAYFTIPNGSTNVTDLAKQAGKPVKPKPWYGENMNITPISTSIPGTRTSPLTATPHSTATILPLAIHRSSVESLYCSIVQFFRGKCE